MEKRFSLEEAGKLMGVSANAMRARAKKYPDKYKLERDNSGKIWLWIKPEKLPTLKPSKQDIKSSNFISLKASIEALKLKFDENSNEVELSNRIRELEALLLEKQEHINKQEMHLAKIQEDNNGKDRLIAEKDIRIAEIKSERDEWSDLYKKSITKEYRSSNSKKSWLSRIFMKS